MYPIFDSFSLKNNKANITENSSSPPLNTEALEAVVLFNPSKNRNGAMQAPSNPIINKSA